MCGRPYVGGTCASRVTGHAFGIDLGRGDLLHYLGSGYHTGMFF